MKLPAAIEGGLTGATTLGLIHETLNKISGSPHTNVFKKGRLGKRLRKAASRKGMKAVRQYVRLAGDLLGSSAFWSLSAVGRQNAVLTGGLLGTTAGLGSVFLNGEEPKNGKRVNGHERQPLMAEEEKLSTKILEVSLYTIGGLIAGTLVDRMGGKKRKKR